MLEAKKDQMGSDVQCLYAHDPNQILLINNLKSVSLLQVAEQFEMMPGQEVDLDQFVKIMCKVLENEKNS